MTFAKIRVYAYNQCHWCGFQAVDKIVAEHPSYGVAYFPADDAIHCIMVEHCRRRLMFSLGLLLGEILQVKNERSAALLSALFPE
jgi:hypothetical protein